MFPRTQTTFFIRRSLLLVLVLWSSASAQHLSSARGTAIGAFTALVNDLTSIEWNPAGLVNIRDWELTVSTYAALRRDVPLKGVSLYTAGTAKRFLDQHVIAGSYSPGLSLEFIVPSSFEFQTDGPKIDFEKRIIYREQYALGYAYPVAPDVGLGISARYREQFVTDTQLFIEQGSVGRIRTVDYVANAWHLDIGLSWKESKQWSFGLVAKNLFKFTESEIPQELLSYSLRPVKTLRFGAAYKHSSRMTLAFDIDTEKQGGLGAEWDLDQTVALRHGMLFGARLTPFVAGLTVGGGWSYGPARFDLSYVHFLNQGARQNISVTQFLAQGVSDLGYNSFTVDQVMLSVNVSLGRTRDVWAKIEHVQILSEIYPSSYQIHAFRALGRARVRNVSSTPIEARVSFFVDRFMDAPTETKPYFIEPKAEADIPFTAIFNEAVTSVSSMILKAGEVFVKASPAEGYDDKFQTSVVIRGRNEWDGDVFSLRYFSTPEDPDLLRFTRAVMSKNKDVLATTEKRLEKLRSAALLFDEFASRLTYVNDPKLSKDRVQFPSETLALRGGDCDDMTVCYSSLLASIGMSTAFVDVVPPNKPQDGHIFLLFDTGVPATQATLISENPKRYVIRKNDHGQETVWVPIETTVITDGFQKAWETGAKEYFESVEVGLGIVRGWVRVVDVLPRN